MFIWIDKGKYIAAIKKKFILFFLYLDNTVDFCFDTENYMDTENFWEKKTFFGFSLIYLTIFWI